MSESIPPGPRPIVSSLLAGLACYGSQEPSRKPEAPLATSRKGILLTLHVLFPHHLLDALDLLDRGLVVRLLSPHQAPGKQAIADYHVRSAQVPSSSMSSWRDRGRGIGEEHDAGIEANVESYHVRLVAWHCSCPGFAYAAFAQSIHLDEESGGMGVHMALDETEMGSLQEQARTNPMDDLAGLLFGGVPNSVTRQNHNNHGTRVSESVMPPICKHLLACLLAERCGRIFNCAGDKDTVNDTNGVGQGCRERLVTDYEAAGWAAAGWHI